MKDNAVEQIENFISNQLGINLCSVGDIKVEKQEDGQLTEINIKFIPSTEKE